MNTPTQQRDDGCEDVALEFFAVAWVVVIWVPAALASTAVAIGLPPEGHAVELRGRIHHLKSQNAPPVRMTLYS